MKFSKTELFEAIKNQIAQDAQLSEGGVWRTNERGQHYYINKAGVIEAGMGGKFNGMRPEEMRKKSLEESRNQTLARLKEKREGGSVIDKNSEEYKTGLENAGNWLYETDLDNLKRIYETKKEQLGRALERSRSDNPNDVEYYTAEANALSGFIDGIEERLKEREKIFAEKSVEPDKNGKVFTDGKELSARYVTDMESSTLETYVEKYKEQLADYQRQASESERDIDYKFVKERIDQYAGMIEAGEEELARRASESKPVQQQTASVNTSVAYSKRETPASASGMSESEYSAYINKWKQGVKNSTLTDLAIELQAQVRVISHLLKTRNPNKGVLEREMEIADILADQLLTIREIKQKEIYRDIERLQQLKQQMDI